jgi:hypothetical protein
MTYFYDYYAKEYRERHKDQLITTLSSIWGDVWSERLLICRNVIKNAYAGYREGRNTEELKRLLGEYKGYVSEIGDESARNRYNAFVYRYMIDTHVGWKAIGGRLGVSRDTVGVYINKALDEILIMCMGVPYAIGTPNNRTEAVKALIEKNRILNNMAGEYVLSLFPGQNERRYAERGRSLTTDVMEKFNEAVKAYMDYCYDGDTHIDTDINMAGVLDRCLSSGADCSRIAEKMGCSYHTVRGYMRENERRITAMMFCEGSI